MKRSLFAAAAIFLAAPALAVPDPSLYAQGVAARKDGDNRNAADLLGRYVAAAPNDADGQVQYGYALLALGRLDDADRAFSAALAVAPAYEDARLGRALVAERQGRLADARRLVATAPTDNADANALRARLAPAVPRSTWSFDIDGSYAAVHRQRDWKELGAQLGYRSATGFGVTARIESSRRFGTNDTYGELRVDRYLANGNSVYAIAGGTPDADYRPRWQVGGGGRLVLRPGATPTIFTFDARHAHYPSGYVTTINPGIEQYLSNGRVWLTSQGIGIIADDVLRVGVLGRIDAMASERLRLFAGSAYAPDVSQGFVTRDFSLFGGTAYDLDPRHVIRASIAYVAPRGGSSRTEVSVGTGVRF